MEKRDVSLEPNTSVFHQKAVGIKNAHGPGEEVRDSNRHNDWLHIKICNFDVEKTRPNTSKNKTRP